MFAWASRRRYRRSLKKAIRLTAYKRLRRSPLSRRQRMSPRRLHYTRSVKKRLHRYLSIRRFPPANRSGSPRNCLRRTFIFRRFRLYRKLSWRNRVVRSRIRRSFRAAKNAAFRRRRLFGRLSRLPRARRDYLSGVYIDPLEPLLARHANRLATPRQQNLVVPSFQPQTSAPDSYTGRYLFTMKSRLGFNSRVLGSAMSSPAVAKILSLSLQSPGTSTLIQPRNNTHHASSARQLRVLEDLRAGYSSRTSLTRTNLVPSDCFRYSVNKRLVSSYALQKLKSDLIP